MRHFVAWLLAAAKGYAVKIVNPGGVEVWKQGGGNVKALDDPVAPYGVTPRQIVVGLAQAVADLGVPHPAHIHANNLGVGGNWATTLETMQRTRGPARTLRPHPVSFLRGRAGGAALLASPGAGRLCRQPPQPQRRHRPGRIRRHDLDDRRRAPRLLPPPSDRPQVVQRRRRDGGRLRHRADPLQAREPRPRDAVGDRARVASAWRTIRGGSSCPPITRTAGRSSPTPRSCGS